MRALHRQTSTHQRESLEALRTLEEAQRSQSDLFCRFYNVSPQANEASKGSNTSLAAAVRRSRCDTLTPTNKGFFWTSGHAPADHADDVVAAIAEGAAAAAAHMVVSKKGDTTGGAPPDKAAQDAAEWAMAATMGLERGEAIARKSSAGRLSREPSGGDIRRRTLVFV